MDLIIAMLIGLAVGSAVLAVGVNVNREEQIQERLFRYIESRVEEEEQQEKTRINLRQILEKISRVFASTSYTQRVQYDLLQAGIPLRREYLTLWGGLTFVLPFSSLF